MAWDWAKIGKGALIGLGTVLSIVPAVGPIVGGGLIAVGASINTNKGTVTQSLNSMDPINNAASKLGEALSYASGYTTVAQGGSAINVTGVTNWLKTNWMLIAGGIVALFLLPKLFNSRRR